MTCQDFVACLSDYIERQLPMRVRSECDGHLADCPDCLAYLDSYQICIRAVRLAFGQPADTIAPSE